MAKSIPEQIADLVFARLATVRSDTVHTAFGRRELEKQAGPPRVVAVPLGAPEIKEATMPGEAGYTDQGRALYIRRFLLEWHCHAVRSSGDTTDWAAAETLYQDTLRAIRYITHAAVEFSDEEWTSQQPQQDGFERLGEVISFKSVVDLRLYETRGGTTSLTATPPIVTTATLNDHQET